MRALTAVLLYFVTLSACGGDQDGGDIPECTDVFVDGANSPDVSEGVTCTDSEGRRNLVMPVQLVYDGCTIAFNTYGWWIDDGPVHAGTFDNTFDNITRVKAEANCV